MTDASKNTDIELFREEEGNYHSPSAHITERRKLGINVNGYVIVACLKDWHKAMNNPFLDDSPLTDETLKELGFEKTKAVNTWNNGKMSIELNNGVVRILRSFQTKFTSIGKLKMLIEALKGE